MQRAYYAIAGACYDSPISFATTSGSGNTNPSFPTSNAVLNLDNTAWCTTSTSSSYLQIDFGSLKVVCAIAVQGLYDGSDDVFSTSFKLSFAYTDTDHEWAQFYEEGGMERVRCISERLTLFLQAMTDNIGRV